MAALRSDLIDLYLTAVRDSLTGTLYNDPPLSQRSFDPEVRQYGWDWPSTALTMIGTKRMDNLRSLVESVLGNHIEGDLMETGVWRGGAVIYMRAVLRAYRVTDRRVWAADSFEGLPEPDTKNYPEDAESKFHEQQELSVSLEEVRDNFKRYGLLDDQVVFLKGWFRDTLPAAPVEKLALLRLDGDMYESTMDALKALYDKLSPGGYVIVDDYHVVPSCRKAVADFCATRRIAPKLEEIDGVGVFWRKPLNEPNGSGE
ncbi:MAG: TylF/MycF family methyltransferase [Candidatus Omnitrophica bacterium]|nr:TylF/MycF family methyltransferase [Candidatus Omnitrophota bacterium]